MTVRFNKEYRSISNARVDEFNGKWSKQLAGHHIIGENLDQENGLVNMRMFTKGEAMQTF